MTLLIDPPAWHAHGRQWSHLVSDTSLAELHEGAARLGIPRRAFEGDHYDVPADLYARALEAGAEPVSTRRLLTRLHAAGLRRPKRRGEKVLASDNAGGDRRADVVLARAVPEPHGTHRVVLLDPDGLRLRTLRSPDGADLPRWPAAGPAAGDVLGFRRLWSTHEGRRQVRHEGVLHLPAAGAGDGGLPGERWTPLGELPARWWLPLLAASGLLPAP